MASSIGSSHNDPISALPVATIEKKKQTLDLSKLNEKQAQQAWEIFNKTITARGKLLITEELDKGGYKELCERLSLKPALFFKGIFELVAFPQYAKNHRINFTMTDAHIPISLIKKEIGGMANVNPRNLQIYYAAMKLTDRDDFDKINRHGRGGEVFKVRYFPSSPSSPT